MTTTIETLKAAVEAAYGPFDAACAAQREASRVYRQAITERHVAIDSPEGRAYYRAVDEREAAYERLSDAKRDFHRAVVALDWQRAV